METAPACSEDLRGDCDFTFTSVPQPRIQREQTRGFWLQLFVKCLFPKHNRITKDNCTRSHCSRVIGINYWRYKFLYSTDTCNPISLSRGVNVMISGQVEVVGSFQGTPELAKSHSGLIESGTFWTPSHLFDIIVELLTATINRVGVLNSPKHYIGILLRSTLCTPYIYLPSAQIGTGSVSDPELPSGTYRKWKILLLFFYGEAIWWSSCIAKIWQHFFLKETSSWVLFQCIIIIVVLKTECFLTSFMPPSAPSTCHRNVI